MRQTSLEMFEWLPDGVELMHDVSAADWIVSSLEPWERDGVRLTSFMPARFEADARIFHPAEDMAGAHRWANLGAERGVTLSPETGFAEVMGLHVYGDQNELWEGRLDAMPSEGAVPHEQCRVLGELLASHTQTPGVCWFGVWTGWGVLWPVAPTAVFREIRRHRVHAAWWRRMRARASARAQNRRSRAIPQVQMPHGREQFLFRGNVRAACSFEPMPGDYVSPNAWWPDDRAWMVVTEVDDFTSYVGGTREAIDAILASSDLESIEVPHDVRIVNW